MKIILPGARAPLPARLQSNLTAFSRIRIEINYAPFSRFALMQARVPALSAKKNSGQC